MPDLETPGSNARAWAIPIVRDSFNERSNILLPPSSSLSAKYNTLAIKIYANAVITKIALLSSIKSLIGRNNPKAAAGITPITISLKI